MMNALNGKRVKDVPLKFLDMKFLFVVQGEGRGHFTQALAMKELLCQRGDEVVGVMVGKSETRELPEFFTRKIGVSVWTFSSPNFLPTAHGKRPGLVKSVLYNILHLPDYNRSVKYVRRQIKESGAEVVINFYELLTGVACFFNLYQIPLICIGHQYLFLHSDFSFPEGSSRIQLFFLRFFTRLTALGATRKLALSYYPLAPDGASDMVVVPPLIRREVKETRPFQGDYILGYLLNNGYVSEVKAWHDCHSEVCLHFFWDKKEETECLELAPGLTMHRIDDVAFIRYMAGCRAYSTTAGFESVCEALYLNKPIVMVPVHIEQECNAFDAVRMGAGIVSDSFDLDGLLGSISSYNPQSGFKEWVDSAERLIYSELHQVAVAQKELSITYYFHRLRHKLSFSFK